MQSANKDLICVQQAYVKIITDYDKFLLVVHFYNKKLKSSN